MLHFVYYMVAIGSLLCNSLFSMRNATMIGGTSKYPTYKNCSLIDSSIELHSRKTEFTNTYLFRCNIRKHSNNAKKIKLTNCTLIGVTIDDNVQMSNKNCYIISEEMFIESKERFKKIGVISLLCVLLIYKKFL